MLPRKFLSSVGETPPVHFHAKLLNTFPACVQPCSLTECKINWSSVEWNEVSASETPCGKCGNSVNIGLILDTFDHIFFICWITLHLGEFQSAAIGKNENTNWAWSKIVQNHRTFTSIVSVKHTSIRLVVKFGPKHQFLYYDYHSNGFFVSFYVSKKPNNHFVVFH